MQLSSILDDISRKSSYNRFANYSEQSLRTSGALEKLRNLSDSSVESLQIVNNQDQDFATLRQIF